jgi:hypothetical protein
LQAIINECVEKDRKHGFIFFIDDLDRIDPPIAVELLELLKNIFTLNHCVFILAIDYDVVIKGLEPKFGKISATNEREFRSFFDKIIQVPFSMPVSSYKIDSFLKDSLLSTNYLNAAQTENKDLIRKFSEISALTVGSNPRSLKRLLNSLLLISCISNAKDSKEEEPLNDLDLLVNFALVSIQIAYPPVYRLLVSYPGFDKWDNKVALQMNLKELDAQSIEKLKTTDEFDEEWEQVLFRLCENDHYLKQRALQISRLLNSLKVYIIEAKSDNVGELIGSLISLSSVTNLEGMDKPVEEYHQSWFLKEVRWRLIDKMREKIPEIKDWIDVQGKRVQTNAYIKITESEWYRYLNLSSYADHKGVSLEIYWYDDDSAFCKNKSELKEELKKYHLLEEFEKIRIDFYQMIKKYPKSILIKDFEDGIKNDGGYHQLELYAAFCLPKTDDFFKEENVELLSNLVVDFYHIRENVFQLYKKYIELDEGKSN